MPDIDGDNMELEQSGDPNVTNNLYVGISRKKNPVRWNGSAT
jgi:hypothetical protein